MIAVRNERHGRDTGVEQFAALFQFQRRAGLGEVGRDIAHGDGALERGREAAAGDLADLIAFAVEDERTLAHGLAAVDIEADALLRRAILELGEDAHRAREASLGAAALIDGEGQAGHHRRGIEVEVVAVERQARLKPKRITRAEADRLGQLVGADYVGKRGGGGRRYGNLESVLAGVTGAADPQRPSLPAE